MAGSNHQLLKKGQAPRLDESSTIISFSALQITLVAGKSLRFRHHHQNHLPLLHKYSIPESRQMLLWQHVSSIGQERRRGRDSCLLSMDVVAGVGA
nr:hypothetical protein Itr_chr12CG19080 [Ipomoea trifida]